MSVDEQKSLQEISEKAFPRVIEKLTQFLEIPESCLITFHIGGPDDQLDAIVSNGLHLYMYAYFESMISENFNNQNGRKLSISDVSFYQKIVNSYFSRIRETCNNPEGIKRIIKYIFDNNLHNNP